MRLARGLLLLAVAVSLAAQGRKTATVTGHVVSESGLNLDGYQVVARVPGSLDSNRSAYTGANGRFDIADIPEGYVEFEVRTLRGEKVASRVSQVPSHGTLEIPLPEGKRGPGGVVSMYRLSHKVPRKAQKLWDKAAKLHKSGKAAEAEAKLREALSLDPEFASALEQVGLYAFHRGDVAEAQQLLTRAAELDDAEPRYQSHAAVASFMSNQSEDAERFARRALRLDPEDRRARYVLGLALLQQNRNRSEVIENLESAKAAFPRAAEVLKQLGE